MSTHMLLDGNITITHAPADLLRKVREGNTWKNPAFWEAIRQGRNTHDIAAEVTAYRETPDGLVLPRGYLADLLALAPDCQVSDRRTDVLAGFPPLHGVTLRDYQERAVTGALESEQGLIEAPTGAGKTLIGLALLSRLGRRALVLTHSRELARQWREVIATRLNVAAGMVGAGSWSEGEAVTVAMLQTLHRNPERAHELGAGYGVVLVDECHHLPAATFSEVASWLPARFRYGLSATPQRRDGLDVLTRV